MQLKTVKKALPSALRKIPLLPSPYGRPGALLTGALMILWCLPVYAAPVTVIHHLKDLSLRTILAEDGAPRTVIIAPEDNPGAQASRALHDRIQALTNADLVVYGDRDIDPEQVLQRDNVIAVGNRSTNKFIDTLYRQWYVILDLKYPGPGGYVVRSLHDPYGTGRNVIFAGGSDEAGVSQACKVLADMIRPGRTVSLGWTMKIKLGKGMEHPPAISPYSEKWSVYSWDDCWRKTNPDAYQPATFFGWNPISVAGVLYYMTGQKEYLDTFKLLAMPSPGKVPRINRTDSAFSDPANPLVKSDHYRSHLVDCIWDLIEESPLFTNQERLFITNKLLQHQLALDPHHAISVPNGDRHALWHMMNIYTGSRYFAKYYPDAIWQKRIENVRKGFRSFIGDPTWAEQDTLGWVSTSIEPVMDFFLMDGPGDFVQSGTARTLVRGLEVLMNGSDAGDDFGGYLSIGLMHKTASLLDDGRYIWMVRQLAYDLDIFRIGQSFWPDDGIGIKPPLDLAGTITVAPLSRTDWIDAQTPVPLANAFQILSYRTGLDKTDDYFLFDGFNGKGRNPYHLNNITKLRMFGGNWMLVGYANDVSVLYNGMADAHVSRAAGLKDSFASESLAFIETEVPDMPGSTWQRHFLYTKNKAMIFDKILPHEAGEFDVTRYWQTGPIKRGSFLSRRATFYDVFSLQTTEKFSPEGKLEAGLIFEHISRNLKPEEGLILGGMISDNRKPKLLRQVAANAFLVTGTEESLESLGRVSLDRLSIDAEFAYLDRERLFLSGATLVSAGEHTVFRSETPVTLLWDLRKGTLTARSRTEGRPAEAVADTTLIHFSGNVPELTLTIESDKMRRKLNAVLDELGRMPDELETNRVNAETSHPDQWAPEWRKNLGDRIFLIKSSSIDDSLWAATGSEWQHSLLRINGSGATTAQVAPQSEILSLQTPRTAGQAREFGVLVGERDDSLTAYSNDGRELWKIRTQIDPSFRIGDRYEAPWFTDPGPKFKMTGVYSILVDDLWGTGTDEIAIGRPSTVEFRTLNGQFKGRVPTHWGNNTALARLRPRFSAPILLVGKAFTSYPWITGIDSSYKNVSDQMFSTVGAGFTSMDAWMQRGMSQLLVADIERDGAEEVIYCISGNWNELRVYDGTTGRPKWIRYFGPDKTGAVRSVRGLLVMDSQTPGMKMIIVGLANGWVHAFSENGNLVWQRHFQEPVTALARFPGTAFVVIGRENGALTLLTQEGKILREGHEQAAVTDIEPLGAGVAIAGSEGTLSRYGVH